MRKFLYGSRPTSHGGSAENSRRHSRQTSRRVSRYVDSTVSPEAGFSRLPTVREQRPPLGSGHNSGRNSVGHRSRNRSQQIPGAGDQATTPTAFDSGFASRAAGDRGGAGVHSGFLPEDFADGIVDHDHTDAWTEMRPFHRAESKPRDVQRVAKQQSPVKKDAAAAAAASKVTDHRLNIRSRSNTRDRSYGMRSRRANTGASFRRSRTNTAGASFRRSRSNTGVDMNRVNKKSRRNRRLCCRACCILCCCLLLLVGLLVGLALPALGFALDGVEQISIDDSLCASELDVSARLVIYNPSVFSIGARGSMDIKLLGEQDVPLAAEESAADAAEAAGLSGEGELLASGLIDKPAMTDAYSHAQIESMKLSLGAPENAAQVINSLLAGRTLFLRLQSRDFTALLDIGFLLPIPISINEVFALSLNAPANATSADTADSETNQRPSPPVAFDLSDASSLLQLSDNADRFQMTFSLHLLQRLIRKISLPSLRVNLAMEQLATGDELSSIKLSMSAIEIAPVEEAYDTHNLQASVEMQLLNDPVAQGPFLKSLSHADSSLRFRLQGDNEPSECWLQEVINSLDIDSSPPTNAVGDSRFSRKRRVQDSGNEEEEAQAQVGLGPLHLLVLPELTDSDENFLPLAIMTSFELPFPVEVAGDLSFSVPLTFRRPAEPEDDPAMLLTERPGLQPPVASAGWIEEPAGQLIVDMWPSSFASGGDELAVEAFLESSVGLPILAHLSLGSTDTRHQDALGDMLNGFYSLFSGVGKQQAHLSRQNHLVLGGGLLDAAPAADTGTVQSMISNTVASLHLEHCGVDWCGPYDPVEALSFVAPAGVLWPAGPFLYGVRNESLRIYSGSTSEITFSYFARLPPFIAASSLRRSGGTVIPEVCVALTTIPGVAPKGPPDFTTDHRFRDSANLIGYHCGTVALSGHNLVILNRLVIESPFEAASGPVSELMAAVINPVGSATMTLFAFGLGLRDVNKRSILNRLLQRQVLGFVINPDSVAVPLATVPASSWSAPPAESNEASFLRIGRQLESVRSSADLLASEPAQDPPEEATDADTASYEPGEAIPSKGFNVHFFSVSIESPETSPTDNLCLLADIALENRAMNFRLPQISVEITRSDQGGDAQRHDLATLFPGGFRLRPAQSEGRRQVIRAICFPTGQTDVLQDIVDFALTVNATDRPTIAGLALPRLLLSSEEVAASWPQVNVLTELYRGFQLPAVEISEAITDLPPKEWIPEFWFEMLESSSSVQQLLLSMSFGLASPPPFFFELKTGAVSIEVVHERRPVLQMKTRHTLDFQPFDVNAPLASPEDCGRDFGKCGMQVQAAFTVYRELEDVVNLFVNIDETPLILLVILRVDRPNDWFGIHSWHEVEYFLEIPKFIADLLSNAVNGQNGMMSGMSGGSSAPPPAAASATAMAGPIRCFQFGMPDLGDILNVVSTKSCHLTLPFTIGLFAPVPQLNFVLAHAEAEVRFDHDGLHDLVGIVGSLLNLPIELQPLTEPKKNVLLGRMELREPVTVPYGELKMVTVHLTAGEAGSFEACARAGYSVATKEGVTLEVQSTWQVGMGNFLLSFPLKLSNVQLNPLLFAEMAGDQPPPDPNADSIWCNGGIGFELPFK